MGNRRLKKRNKIKKIMRTIIAVMIFYILLYISYGFYKENKIRLVEEKNESNIEIEKNMEKNTNIASEESNVPATYLGFEVTAQLIIPNINLETNILKNYTEEAMDVCASKFWGPEPNEIGNFCIVGHNYNKENMFNNLIDLKIRDAI